MATRTHDGQMVTEYSPDAELENADWTKQSWDWPPYKSADFLEAIGGVENLPAFRNTSAYRNAVEGGIILDDEWLLEFVTPSDSDDPKHRDDDEHEPGKPRRGKVNVHIHRGK